MKKEDEETEMWRKKEINRKKGSNKQKKKKQAGRKKEKRNKLKERSGYMIEVLNSISPVIHAERERERGGTAGRASSCFIPPFLKPHECVGSFWRIFYWNNIGFVEDNKQWPLKHTHTHHYDVPTQTNTLSLNLLAEMRNLWGVFLYSHWALLSVRGYRSTGKSVRLDGYCILIFFHNTHTHTHAPNELLVLRI